MQMRCGKHELRKLLACKWYCELMTTLLLRMLKFSMFYSGLDRHDNWNLFFFGSDKTYGVCINAVPQTKLFLTKTRYHCLCSSPDRTAQFSPELLGLCDYYKNVPVKIVWLYITVVCNFRDLFWSTLEVGIERVRGLRCNHVEIINFFRTWI